MSTCKRMWTDREIRSMAVNSVENKSNLKVFENIVDKDGHKRFIEGNLANIIEGEGIDVTYAKWSLSGTHLMIVMQMTTSVGASFTYGDILGRVNLPTWALTKVVAVWGAGYIENIAVPFRDSTWSDTQNLSCVLVKDTDNLKLMISGNLSITTKDKTGRIQFDLLIDDE